MRYVEVAVDAPVAHSRTFSYSIPREFTLEPGQLVWVPFGRRITQGLVTELASAPQVEVTRDVLQPVEPSPLVSTIGLKLAPWLSAHYLCSLFDALSLTLPPGFKDHVLSRIIPSLTEESDLDSLDPKVQSGLQGLRSKRHMRESDFIKLLGRNGGRELTRLIDRGLVRRHLNLPRPRSYHYQCYLNPMLSDQSEEHNPSSIQELSPRQSAVLEAVQSHGSGYPMSLANKQFGPGVGNALVEKGLLSEEWVREEPESSVASPKRLRVISTSPPLEKVICPPPFSS